MMFRPVVPLLLALLLPLQAGAAPDTSPMAPASALPEEAVPEEGNAAAFDRLFNELDLGGLGESTPEEARDHLAQLRRLLPPGDARRDLRYRYLACSLPPEDAAAAVEFASRGLADARRLGDKHAQVQFLYC